MTNFEFDVNDCIRDEIKFLGCEDFKIAHDSEMESYIPEVDKNYLFKSELTRAIVAGICFNKKVFIHGPHGTGKSTYIEQICARLKYPCLRVNLDGNISRTDLIGRDVIKVIDGKQTIQFQNGIIPWAMQRPIVLILDEYDSAKSETLFVLQKILETNGTLFLMEENKVIVPHKMFRIFATANTSGGGDENSVYHGTNLIHQGQLDRWDVVLKLDYLDEQDEIAMLKKRFNHWNALESQTKQDLKTNASQAKDDCGNKNKHSGGGLGGILPNADVDFIQSIVRFANLVRKLFADGEISMTFSTRLTIAACENFQIFKDVKTTMQYTFLNRIPSDDLKNVSEIYQRCFG